MSDKTVTLTCAYPQFILIDASYNIPCTTMILLLLNLPFCAKRLSGIVEVYNLYKVKRTTYDTSKKDIHY